jgi:hypothetical protein
MGKTLYEKIGRKYIPVRDYSPEQYDSLPKGFHLFFVEPGSRSIRFNIVPEYAGLLAASKKVEDAMITAMREAEKLQPTKHPITKKQRDAWESFNKAMGDNMHTLERASIHDIVRAGIKALVEG